MNAITPLQRWTRDDWIIPCVLQDTSGTPVNLTGSVIAAEFYLPGYSIFQPLSVANGGILRVSDPQGSFTVLISRLLTARAKSDASGLINNERARVLIYRIDTNGKRQTLGLVPFSVFDGREDQSIDLAPSISLVSATTQLVLVVAASQGPAGPSNIPAAQISDSTNVGQSVIRAQDAAAIRALLGVPGYKRVAVDDINYDIQATDTYVAMINITARRTLTLPLAAAYQPGVPLTIAGESSNVSTDNVIVVAAAGDDSIGTQDFVEMAYPHGKLVFYSNGTNLWVV